MRYGESHGDAESGSFDIAVAESAGCISGFACVDYDSPKRPQVRPAGRGLRSANWTVSSLF